LRKVTILAKFVH